MISKLYKKSLLLIVLVLFFQVSFMFINNEKVYAAAPICYESSEPADTNSFFDETFTSVTDCNDIDFFIGVASTFQTYIGPPETSDDNCYVYYQNGPGVFESPLGSADCKRLADGADPSTRSAPRCFWFKDVESGFLDNLEDVPDLAGKIGTADAPGSASIDCTLLGGGLIFPVLENGYCYLIGTPGSTVSSGNSGDTAISCNALFIRVVTALSATSESTGFTSIDEEQRNDLADCGPPDQTIEECLELNPIVNLVKTAINFFSAGVGIVVVGVIILAGIQYSTAGANPNAVAGAKGRIVNAVVALIMYALLFAFIQWLIPGGIFTT